MIKKIRISVDQGNSNYKTPNFVFPTGLTIMDKKPIKGTDYLYYKGKYYTHSEKRIKYARDKTEDFRFFVLTLFAIAKELERTGQIQEEDVVQLVLCLGLPPTHYKELHKKYEEFFESYKDVVEFIYNDKTYHICFQETKTFMQDYAAMVTIINEIEYIPDAVGIDIGGFTVDYLVMESGVPNPDEKDSLEGGIITLYNDIISAVNSEYDLLLKEKGINAIIAGKTEYYDDAINQFVLEKVQIFVTEMMNGLREKGIDLKSSYAIFIGGGSLLLKEYLLKNERLNRYLFIEDIKANAIGYNILYRFS